MDTSVQPQPVVTHNMVDPEGFTQEHGFSRLRCQQLQLIVTRNQFHGLPSEDDIQEDTPNLIEVAASLDKGLTTPESNV